MCISFMNEINKSDILFVKEYLLINWMKGVTLPFKGFETVILFNLFSYLFVYWKEMNTLI